MRIFLNFFLKVFAFFTACLVFVLLLTFFLNLIPNYKKNSEFFFKEGDINSPNKIALLKLNGPILNDPPSIIDIGLFNNLEFIYVNQIKQTLERLKNDQIKGLLISINSPGGSVSASNNLYNALNEFKIENDISIFFHTNEMLASGGYWAALSSDKIFADYGSLIGSIGVRGPDWIYYANPVAISKGLLNGSIETKDGIKIYNNIAGRSKDLFNSFRKPTETELKALKNIVNNIYNDFVVLVSKNRNIDSKTVTEEIGALIFDADTAKNNFLIDGVQDFENTKINLIKFLSLKDYQIIEMKKRELNFFQKINYISNISLTNNLETNNNICDIFKNSMNVIFVLNDKYNC